MRALVVELLASKVAIFHFAEHFLFCCAPQATDVAFGFADRLHDYYLQNRISPSWFLMTRHLAKLLDYMELATPKFRDMKGIISGFLEAFFPSPNYPILSERKQCQSRPTDLVEKAAEKFCFSLI